MANDCAVVTFRVRDARPAAGKTLFALVDVEMEIDGVTVVICGVQARRRTEGGTSIHLPTYKGSDGVWHAAMCLPDEVKAPLTEAVVAFLVEEGLAGSRFRQAAAS